MLREQRLERRETLVPHVTGVVEIALLLKLPARELDPLRVHDDDAVSPVHMRRESRLVLTAQNLRDTAREPAERLPGSIHQEPTAHDVLRLERERFHVPT